MLEGARIMKRRFREVNMRRAPSRPIWFFIVAASLVVATSACDGRERQAERLWRQAQDRVAKGETQAAVDLLQKLIDSYPDAAIAAKARDQIVVYRGLAHAVQSYPSRRAREIMVQVARAIEADRARSGRAPAALDELVPRAFAAVPVDPWDRAFVYAPSGRGYRLTCLGSDGAAGGEGDAADLVVVNGEFTASP